MPTNPNPAITDAVRDRMFNRLGVLGGMYNDLLSLELLYHPKNTSKFAVRMLNADEDGTDITDIRITDCVIDTDTDAEGIVYGTLTDGVGGTGHTISFYKDQGRTSKIADLDAAIDDAGTGTIAPDSASFNLAGTITVGTITGNISFAFYVVPPPMHRLINEFDGVEEEDSAVRVAAEQFVASAYNSFRQLRRNLRSVAQLLVLGTATSGGLFKRRIGFSNDSSLLEGGLSRNSAGGIVNQPKGFLESLRRGMAGNLSGSGAIKVGPATSTGTPAFGGAWTGTNSGCATDDRAVAGTVTATCSKGLDSSAPRFRLNFTPTDSRKLLGVDYTVQDLEFELTIGQTFRSHLLGISSMTIDYAATVATVGTLLNTTASLWSVTGLSTANSTSGKTWCEYDGTDITFYATEAGRDAADADDVVASCTYPGAATAFTAEGSAGITIVGKTGAAPVSGDTGDVDFSPPVATSPADYFTVAIAVTTEPGILQRLVGRGLIGAAWYLNSAATPNITANQVLAGSLFGGRTRVDPA